ncbi:unannotated protein [freshwater metagenome]|uniref:Unannotated protein n=1 Tax=freshwater metagenome TaxID=449393 RepID=A0A6J7HKV8_9ZZZZ
MELSDRHLDEESRGSLDPDGVEQRHTILDRRGRTCRGRWKVSESSSWGSGSPARPREESSPTGVPTWSKSSRHSVTRRARSSACSAPTCPTTRCSSSTTGRSAASSSTCIPTKDALWRSSSSMAPTCSSPTSVRPLWRGSASTTKPCSPATPDSSTRSSPATASKDPMPIARHMTSPPSGPGRASRTCSRPPGRTRPSSAVAWVTTRSGCRAPARSAPHSSRASARGTVNSCRRRCCARAFTPWAST